MENNIDFESLQEQLMKQLNESLINNFETIAIEGLRRKGFEFDNKKELYNFTKKHIVSLQKGNQKTFLVKDIPFLVWNENIETDFTGEKYTVNYGSYSFL